MAHLGPHDIRRILAVTDALGLHRESVSVPLARRGPGGVRVTPDGRVEIVAPADGDLAAWLAGLAASLKRLDLGGVRRAT